MPLTRIKSLGITDGTIAAADLATGVGGKLLQVVSTTKTDTFSTSSNSYVDVTGLSVSITPSSSSNKILVIASIYAGNSSQYCFARLTRDSTAIAVGDANSSNTRCSFANLYSGDIEMFRAGSQNYLDSPATTSSITYKVQIQSGTASTVYFNYGGATGTDSSRGRTASSITVMEIAV